MKKYYGLLLIISLLLFSCQPVVPKADLPLLVLTFDDDSRSIYDTAFPIMQEFGYTGTNVITTSIMNEPERLTWQQLHEITDAGWEVAGHTFHHYNFNNLTLPQAEFEIMHDLAILREQGFDPVSFALPLGKASPSVLEIIAAYYTNIRNSQDTVNLFPVNNKAVGYFPVQNFYTEEEVIRRIDSAVFRGECLLIIGFHRFYPDDTGICDNCKPEEFRRILTYISENNFQVLNLKDALPLCR